MKSVGGICFVLFCITWSGVVPAAAEDISAGLIQTFRHGNASALQSLLPQEGRVQLAIEAAGIASGNYSAKQAVALLQQATEKFDTISFEMEERSGAIRGEWVIRSKDAGTRVKVIIYVSVQSRNGARVITSIQGN